MSFLQIAVVGVGGVGGYFGAKLCQMRGEASPAISFIARGAHLRAIQADGLTLSSDEGELRCHPALATDDFGALPQLDLCLLCIKQFDLLPALEKLKPLITPRTVLLPLLNGVDIYDRIREVIDVGVVLPACVYVGTHIEHPGKIRQKGGACRILFGPDPRHLDFDPSPLLHLLQRANIKAHWTENVQEEIWRKFIFICAFGLVTAARNKTVGEIIADPILRAETDSVMREVVAVARARDVLLPAEAITVAMAKAGDFPFETKTSFQRDFENPDKPDERDLFAGAMLRSARQFGLDLPAVQTLATVIQARKPAP